MEKINFHFRDADFWMSKAPPIELASHLAGNSNVIPFPLERIKRELRRR